MKVKWVGIAAVLAAVIAIVAMKNRPAAPQAGHPSGPPQVLLVATREEAASPTRCGQIVHEVRAAAQRGIAVRELTPDSNSELITRYHVLVTPTVLIFGDDGAVRSRFEGEEPETLAAIRSEMGRMRP